MAMTGYYRTMQRPRAHQPLSMLKYDPIGMRPSLLSILTTKLKLRLLAKSSLYDFRYMRQDENVEATLRAMRWPNDG